MLSRAGNWTPPQQPGFLLPSAGSLVVKHQLLEHEHTQAAAAGVIREPGGGNAPDLVQRTNYLFHRLGRVHGAAHTPQTGSVTCAKSTEGEQHVI